MLERPERSSRCIKRARRDQIGGHAHELAPRTGTEDRRLYVLLQSETVRSDEPEGVVRRTELDVDLRNQRLHLEQPAASLKKRVNAPAVRQWRLGGKRTRWKRSKRGRRRRRMLRGSCCCFCYARWSGGRLRCKKRGRVLKAAVVAVGIFPVAENARQTFRPGTVCGSFGRWPVLDGPSSSGGLMAVAR